MSAEPAGPGADEAMRMPSQALFVPGPEPDYGRFHGFHHVKFWVGNSMQAAQWYITRLGFQPYAKRTLTEGERSLAAHAVRNGDVIFVFESSLDSTDTDFGAHMQRHGDGVRDVAFHVENAELVYEFALSRGAQATTPLLRLTEAGDKDGSKHGTVVSGSVLAYNATTHTFLTTDTYRGHFLPGFSPVEVDDPLCALLPPVSLRFIDHVVCNQEDGKMMSQVEWYRDKLRFHAFWCVDEKTITTRYTSLRSTVMTDWWNAVKLPINEPAKGLRRSQIQEFVDYYAGAGVQHMALRTDDIIAAVTALRARGVQFLAIPDAYYDLLRERNARSSTKIKEDIARLQELRILADQDDDGYLLQIFTLPIEDRPTFFIEIIQRANHDGFGAGNFQALFEAIERAQSERGNL